MILTASWLYDLLRPSPPPFLSFTQAAYLAGIYLISLSLPPVLWDTQGWSPLSIYKLS